MLSKQFRSHLISTVPILLSLNVGVASAQGIDVVFKIDESGSMGNEISGVRNNVKTIFSGLPAGSHAGVVGFGTSSLHGGYKPHIHCPLTSNEPDFQTCVDGLVASGSIEPGYDAIYLSATDSFSSGSLGFTGAPYCNILISDEPSNNDDYTQADAIAAMQAVGGIFFGITSPGSSTDSYDDIAAATGGQMFDLNSFNIDPTGVLTAVLEACKVSLGYMIGTRGAIPDESGNHEVSYGFELYCSKKVLDEPNNVEPNHLRVNWGRKNYFHLESLTSVKCSDDPNIDEGDPITGFDTLEGEGVGHLSDHSPATIRFTFTDAGEPGQVMGDTATILITNGGVMPVLSVTENIIRGNNQALLPPSSP